MVEQEKSQGGVEEHQIPSHLEAPQGVSGLGEGQQQERHRAVPDPTPFGRATFVSTDDEHHSAEQHEGAQVLLGDHVEVSRVGEGQHDQVGEEDTVFIVLCPQRRELQRARVRMIDQCHVAPLVVRDDVHAVGVDHPEVHHRRNGEAEESGAGYQP